MSSQNIYLNWGPSGYGHELLTQCLDIIGVELRYNLPEGRVEVRDGSADWKELTGQHADNIISRIHQQPIFAGPYNCPDSSKERVDWGSSKSTRWNTAVCGLFYQQNKDVITVPWIKMTLSDM